MPVSSVSPPPSPDFFPGAGPSPGALWEVAVFLPLPGPLTYRLPPDHAAQARPGCLVRVPVGRRQSLGYLLAPTDAPPPGALKEVAALVDPEPRFPPELVPLFRWLAAYYRYPLGEALKHLLPGKVTPSRPEVWVAAREEWEGPADGRHLGPRARMVLEYLRAHGPLPLAALAAEFPRVREVVRRLAARGWLRLEDREPASPLPAMEPAAGVPLLPEQAAATEAIIAGVRQRDFAPFLLYGVTASGKTEVYLAAAAATLALGRQVLVLAPEIALTHPLAQEFRRRFGERVALLHSGLSEAQRLAQWRRLLRGEADIAVGARSAVFAPLKNPGLIVVDEEHDPAYKNEGGLPYQARDVALYRAKLQAAAAVLVSATPAAATFYRAQRGVYTLLSLPRRVTPQDLPLVELVDLRRQRGGRGPTVISPPLAQALEETLSRGEQALLFLNRRGYAAVLFCLMCGHVLSCRHCSVALTFHRAAGALLCHYCGYRQDPPETCPQCRSSLLKRYGIGTEKVEAEVRRLFPQARVARLDRDIAPHSGKALGILEEFGRGEIDVLVGTQMITKGHHFPGVTLVGVIAGDLSLFFPEYHAGERTFQLLTQVAGRAGRGAAPGRVLIQTYNPGHYVFQAVCRQEYPAFYEAEIEARRRLGYPPFTRLALIRLSGPEESAVTQAARTLARRLHHRLAADPKLASLVRLLGPAPAGVAKLQGRWRWQLLLKACGRPALNRVLDFLPELWQPSGRGRIDLTLDIDPGSVW
mgnify:CR=1 FL=1